MKKIKVSYRFILIALLTILVSCSTIKEDHYFKDKVDTNNNLPNKTVPNYYKVKIRGYSFLSSSRYLSGYFDKSALNLYFNEMSQPEKANLFGTKKSDNEATPFADETGNELVLILSTNSKAFTDKIGGIVKNQTILNSLVQITQKDKVNEANKVISEISKVDEDIQMFILNADSYLDGISTKTDAEKKLAIKQFLQSLY